MARVISTEAELRTIIAEPPQAMADKAIGYVDPTSQRFVEASPFFLLATSDADGNCDVTPRGDPPGSVRVLDEHTLVFGDRKGNRRLDSLRNILANPHVGLLFLVPGAGHTLRVNGSARIVADAGYLPSLAVSGITPALAVEVAVEELFMHCSKAFARSALWDPTTWPRKGEVPTGGQLLRSQGKIRIPAKVIDAGLALDERINRY